MFALAFICFAAFCVGSECLEWPMCPQIMQKRRHTFELWMLKTMIVLRILFVNVRVNTVVTAFVNMIVDTFVNTLVDTLVNILMNPIGSAL